MTSPASQITGISPAATDEETAAIVAAIEAATPRVVIVDEETEQARSGGWRFSGRWWAKPMAARRRRPFY